MIPHMQYDEENQALVLRFTEVWTEEDIPGLFSRLREYLGEKEKKNILGDVSQAPTQSYSKEFRKMIAEEAASLSLDKVAVVGANPVLRMMAKVLLAIIGQKWSVETKFFTAEKDALVWLKE